ncbi:MAG TPA: hypothetical protein VMM36_17865 [Opitutaceae bacterium]|nr:hypothetical protein [Opitutaceae bacterium]
MGHLIPAGTGHPKYKKLRITLPLGAEIPDANIEAAVDQAG